VKVFRQSSVDLSLSARFGQLKVIHGILDPSQVIDSESRLMKPIIDWKTVAKESFMFAPGHSAVGEINYTVLAILTVGGVFGVLLAGEGSSDFFIWLRRRAKTSRAKKQLASFVAIFNFFSSITNLYYICN
jgi:hypothetical protein